MNFFTVENLTAGYGRQDIIEHLSFSVDGGSLVGVLGANGSGKTTLLKAICGILSHTGSCILNGTALETLTPRQLAQRCSYIPQRSGISIDISVLDVVLMGFNPRLGLLERPAASMEQKGRRALALAGLEGKEQQNYQTLSEGQKQLCIFARALCCEGHLLLLDEPESALDFRFRYQMLELLRHWLSEDTRAAMVTLHDPSLALNYCHKLLLLSEGRILGTLSPGTDSLPQMEELLGQIYGKISLARVTSRGGREYLVMLREDQKS